MAETDGLTSPIQQLRTHAMAEPSTARRETVNVAADHGATDSRGRQLQQTVSFGALDGGVLLAGFGLAPALVGMMIGAGLGYWYERHAMEKQPGQPA